MYRCGAVSFVRLRSRYATPTTLPGGNGNANTTSLYAASYENAGADCTGPPVTRPDESNVVPSYDATYTEPFTAALERKTCESVPVPAWNTSVFETPAGVLCAKPACGATIG